MALFILTVLTFATTLISTAADDCNGYFNSKNLYVQPVHCSFLKFCCGTCENRYCCSDPFRRLDDDDCFSSDYNIIPIASGVVAIIVSLALLVTCCVCPCCCLYKMCRKTRPMTTTNTTTVVTTQYPQQRLTNTTPYPAYQTVPPQPDYGAQPVYGGPIMPPAPYEGQPFAHGPPPPYQESGMYPAPYSQAAYDGGHPPYPLNPPMQPNFAHPPPSTDNAAQPPYNPAYMEPPKPKY